MNNGVTKSSRILEFPSSYFLLVKIFKENMEKSEGAVLKIMNDFFNNQIKKDLKDQIWNHPLVYY